MKAAHPQSRPRLRGLAVAVLVLLAAGLAAPAIAHIVPPERLHPVAESYRRLGFLLRLNPVPWAEVERDQVVIAAALEAVSAADAETYRAAVAKSLAAGKPPGAERAAAADRKRAAETLFEHSTRAVARTLNLTLESARAALGDYRTATARLEEARQIWAAFEPVVRIADPESFIEMGECWLELANALGYPGVLGTGEVAPDPEAFAADADEIIGYVETNFGERFRVSSATGLAPVPAKLAATLDLELPALLPPGSNLNKQLPRPRQVLNMATRGVDEAETTLVALGDMAFDSALIFGEPARSLGLTCNTCHNKGVTNPALFIPGLSSRAGGIDVSNSFFAPHANNGHFDPLDTPDLRGIRFTAPYGRNGRFDSLREFVRNVIVNEFNGAEPEPLLLDAIIAYMLEFDFLPNPLLAADGTLKGSAPPAARRGAEIFRRPLAGFDGRSCASCHQPSDHFLDRRRHDIGTVAGAEPGSRDRALDTPTLLGVAYTAPYFHDGSQPTLAAVNEWFNERFELGLSAAELADLTAYLEAIGGGVDAYEETLHTLEAELEEFSFFLSTYEFLKERGRRDLIATTLATIAFEIRAHKWTVQDRAGLPVLDRLAALMDEALVALRADDATSLDARVAEYRRLYAANADVLR